MSMLTPRAQQTLRRLNMRQQDQIKDAIYKETADALTALAGDAIAGNVLWFDGNDWQAAGGTPTEGYILTIVSGVPTWTAP